MTAYKYEFQLGDKILRKGITDDLKRRERQHQLKWPQGQIVNLGKVDRKKEKMKW